MSWLFTINCGRGVELGSAMKQLQRKCMVRVELEPGPGPPDYLKSGTLTRHRPHCLRNVRNLVEKHEVFSFLIQSSNMGEGSGNLSHISL